MKTPAVDCGACSMCCYLMAVPDINKPAVIWCEHCERPHGGCKVYNQPDVKPQACSDFQCLWLVSQSRPAAERMIYGVRPDRSKVMMHDARDEENPNVMYVHVDPAHPAAWRWAPIYDHIQQVMRRGCVVHIIIGHRRIVLELGKESVTREDGAAARTELRVLG